MNSTQLIETLLNGASLSSVMVPDPALPSNQPAHDESYKLPFIFINDNRFIAQTNNMHRGIRKPERGLHSSAHTFIYTCNYDYTMIVNCPRLHSLLVGKMDGRYSRFEWRSRQNFEMVWKSTTPSQLEKVYQTIENGEEMKLAIRLNNNWYIAPIDSAVISPDKKDFLVRTETAYSPHITESPELFSQTISQVETRRARPVSFIQEDIHSTPIYYVCNANGSYYTFFDEDTRTLQNYEELRIFSRNNAVTETLRIEYL